MRALAAIALVLAACTSAELQQAPSATSTPCSTDPVIYCDAGAPGAAGCTGTSDPADPDLQRFPRDRAYPVDCTAALFSGARENDGTCSVSRTCVCVADDGGASARWTCR